jgi:hypothetical protein
VKETDQRKQRAEEIAMPRRMTKRRLRLCAAASMWGVELTFSIVDSILISRQI